MTETRTQALMDQCQPTGYAMAEHVIGVCERDPARVSEVYEELLNVSIEEEGEELDASSLVCDVFDLYPTLWDKEKRDCILFFFYAEIKAFLDEED